jgi:hypothetical protein
MGFEVGTKCEECKKVIPNKKSWVKYRGKYFCNWVCEGKYEKTHQDDRIDPKEVENSLPPSKRNKYVKKEQKGLTLDIRSSFLKRKPRRRKIKR